MKSFLRQKQAEAIVALVMAIAVLAMVIGLGLSTGIARAASPSPSAYSITIDNPVRLNQQSGGAIGVSIHWTCPVGALVNAEIDVVENVPRNVSASASTPQLTCNGQQGSGTLGFGSPSGSFTRGMATATASLVPTTPPVTTTRTVVIA